MLQNDINHNEIPEDIEEYDMLFMGIVNADGSASIFEYDVEEGWDDLPPYIGADHLKRVRTEQLDRIAKAYGYDDPIVAWVDEKQPDGDYILTLEDEEQQPYSFDCYDDLKKILTVDLGAKTVKTYLDDYDDDGRYDPYA